MNLGQLIGELSLKAEIAAASPRAYVRRDRVGVSQADRIVAALEAAPEGLSIRELAAVIQAPMPSTNTVVGILRRAGRVELAHEGPPKRWRLIP